jgi:hypothetical protein
MLCPALFVISLRDSELSTVAAGKIRTMVRSAPTAPMSDEVDDDDTRRGIPTAARVFEMLRGLPKVVFRVGREMMASEKTKNIVEVEEEFLPLENINLTGIFQYLPGEQLRKVVLTDKQLCFGLIEESNSIMLDYIPLHEIVEIRQGHEDIKTMFEMFDTDGDGLLTLQELCDGLAMYGLNPAQTKEMFFPTPETSDEDVEDGASQESSGMLLLLSASLSCLCGLPPLPLLALHLLSLLHPPH